MSGHHLPSTASTLPPSGVRFQGLGAISVVAIGQLVSLLGSGMTTFGLTIWVWQTTGEATHIALLAACNFGPLFLLTPLAGVLVDRWDRKLVMMVSDLASGMGSIAILALLLLDRLDMPLLYLIIAFSGAFRAFQVPAYGAAATMMVEKKHYARVSGILSMPQSSSLILSPILAGALLGLIGFVGILIVDVVTFCVAVASLALIHVPPPTESEEGRSGGPGLGSEMLYGWRYIRMRKPLLGLLVTFFCFNFAMMAPISVLPPMVLARTGNDEMILGAVQALLGLGSLAGALLLSFWGGPRRRIRGVLLGIMVMGLANGVAMGLADSPWGWYVAGFFGSAALPVIAGCTQAIWQAKVPPDVQGRVFAIRRFLSQGSALPAFLIAGPLADHVFEPALAADGAWASFLGPVVGTGPGAGIALMFVLAGLLGMATGIAAYGTKTVREVEELLPDYGAAAEIPYPPPGVPTASSELGLEPAPARTTPTVTS